MSTLTLSAALPRNDRTRALLDGSVQPQGIELVATRLHPSEMFWRQLKYAEFDVSEMSLSSLFIARSHGVVDWIALPVFTSRRFFHTGMWVRAGAGIATPQDLRGKRIGVPEYQQTAAVWSRGALRHEFGVLPEDLEWFMERPPERSHGGATRFAPPPGVRLTYVDPATNLGEMLVRGELDALLHYSRDPNLVDRSRLDLATRPEVRTLFPDPVAEARRYHAKTGLFPLNHTVVVRRALLERHPWVALNLFAAFVEAKDVLGRRRAAELESHRLVGWLHDAAIAAAARDPHRYGIREARDELETLRGYLVEQGLLTRAPALEEVFAEQTLAV